MNTCPELIVMLTHNDQTIENALEIFDQCKDLDTKFWGLKEKGIPVEEMKNLVSIMKQHGKSVALEVVEYTEEEGLEGAKLAIECGCDILMGTCFFDSINTLCKENGIKYMPFVGKVTGRPSILDGTYEEMISQAQEYIEKGAYGIDLLGYRYTGDSYALNMELVSAINAPVCIAGSVDTYRKLDEVKAVCPWSFTVGSAFFDNRFEGSVPEQIKKVREYLAKNK